ncbi:MAG: proline dehydrogenase family protein [Woeseiaceae bacterium]
MSVNLLHRLLIAPIPYLPKSLVWPLSKRYIAGTDLASAYNVVGTLNRLGCSATVDVLGEDSTSKDEVEQARDLYLAAIAGIDSNSLDCNVSVKLSDFGLRVDQEYCYAATRELVIRARERHNFVRIDMEDSSVTEVTLDIYQKLRNEFDNVGTVIQSCMRRSPADVQKLLDTGPTHVRLCKGIYLEPEEIAFTSPEDIRVAFRELLEQLLAGGVVKVGIATHDPQLVEYAKGLIERLQIDRSRYEFQMLLGVAENMRAQLVGDGHPLRVYVPFGERWFAYSVRRLRENPQIAGHIVRNLFTRH